jgi:hypothetical protein
MSHHPLPARGWNAMECNRRRVPLQQVVDLVMTPLPHMLWMGDLGVVRTREDENSPTPQQSHRVRNRSVRLVEVLHDLTHGDYVELQP